MYIVLCCYAGALKQEEQLGQTLSNVSDRLVTLPPSVSYQVFYISHTMNIIQDITSQTSSGTMATARSIGELSEMAAALQESVTGFKVSNDDELVDYEVLDTEGALKESV